MCFMVQVYPACTADMAFAMLSMRLDFGGARDAACLLASMKLEFEFAVSDIPNYHTPLQV
jgi:hypothetical protein